MSAKSKKQKKQKRAQIRTITPQTVKMPTETSSETNVVYKDVAVEYAPAKHSQVQPDIIEGRVKPEILIKELKKIGVLFAIIMFILVVVSVLF